MKMEEWKEYELSELIDEISMGPFGSNIKVECFTDSGVPVLNGSNLVGLKLNEDKFNYVTEEKAASLGKANAYRNDIVITHRGTLGQIVYIPQNSKYDHYVISQSQFRVRCNQKVLPEYLVYYFHTRIGQHQLLSNASQVGVPALARPTTTFQKLRVVLPPLPTQQKIAAILSSLDDKIELNNKINTNLEQQAQALFKNWFVDFEPFGGKMPERWKMGTIADFGDVVCGKTPSTKVKDYYGDKTPFITIPDMHNNVFACYTERYLSEKGELSQKGKTLPQNSVCVSCIATPGLVVMVDEPSQTNQQINSIIPKDNMSSCYVYLTMYYLADTIKMLGSSGSTTANLNKEQFSKIAVLIPTTKDLQNFDKLIKPIFENIKNNQHENKKLTSLRDTLLPKLMNGEINV